MRTQLHVTYGHRWVEKVYEAGKGHTRERDAIAQDQRRTMIEQILNNPGDHDFRTHGYELLDSLDANTRDQVVKSFSGFCGLIEFELDLTVR